MKKLSYVTAIAFAAFVFTGKASANLNVTPITSEDKPVVMVTVPGKETASVSVYSENSDLVHREVFNAGELDSRIYDFSRLDNGVYTFYSSLEYITTIKMIQVMDSQVEVLSKKTEYKPVIKVEEDKILINFFNAEQANLELNIETKDGTYYNGDHGNPITYGKIVNIKDAPRGEYYLTLKASGRTFGQTFNIE